MKFIILLLMGSSIFFMSSCVRSYYSPNAHNVPLFQQKGEVRLQGCITQGDYISGYEVQTAYAPANHFGIMANYFYAHSGDIGNVNLGRFGNGNYFELGGGYFTPLTRHIIFENYAGIGQGNANNDFEDGRYIKNSFRKFFIQPSIGVSGRVIDFAVSARFAHLTTTKLSYHQTANIDEYGYSHELAGDYNQLSLYRDQILVEPCATLRIGWKNLKIQWQMGYMNVISGIHYKMSYTNINFGVYITLFTKNKMAYNPLSK